MRLQIKETKSSKNFYVIKDYLTKDNKRTTMVVEKLGSESEILKKCDTLDPIVWAKKYIDELNKKEKNIDTIIKKSPFKQLENNKQTFFNGGYLFLEKIYYELGLQNICNKISDNYSFKYDLNNILSRLIYGRVLSPSSKLATLDYSNTLLEKPNFDIQHIYRALEVISKNMDFIQSELYKNSKKVINRNSNLLYYDCTNYFFEIEQEDELRKYGKSKENRPTPIVQMGLFLDGNGIPLAFNINPGNTNEQITLKPLEEQIIKDFEYSKFVVCTDAGLSSIANRKFNNKCNRRFITTQSVKKLKQHIKDKAIDLTTGWKLPNHKKTYNISNLRTDEDMIKKYKDAVFYKTIPINENNLEQNLIITYSAKYQEYQRKIRNNQIERAKKLIENNPKKIGKAKSNDPKRFIKTTQITKDGEVAENNIHSIDLSLIENEAKYDGIYAVCTNLDDSVEEIIKINSRRWEIEESFRIMKTEFKSRPVFLSREDRIKAHFTTCFLALMVYRVLESKMNSEFSAEKIIQTLRDMNFLELSKEGFIPSYTRTEITDKIHEISGFRTDYEIVTNKQLKKIFKDIKK